jgi:hypothetical protein
MTTPVDPQLFTLMACPAPGCTSSMAGTMAGLESAEPAERRSRVLRALESHGRFQLPARGVKLTVPDSGGDGHDLTRAARAADSVPGVRVVKTPRAVYFFGLDLLELSVVAPAYCRLAEGRSWKLEDADVPGAGRFCCRTEHVPDAVSHYETMALEIARKTEGV